MAAIANFVLFWVADRYPFETFFVLLLLLAIGCGRLLLSDGNKHK